MIKPDQNLYLHDINMLELSFLNFLENFLSFPDFLFFKEIQHLVNFDVKFSIETSNQQLKFTSLFL